LILDSPLELPRLKSGLFFSSRKLGIIQCGKPHKESAKPQSPGIVPGSNLQFVVFIGVLWQGAVKALAVAAASQEQTIFTGYPV